MPPKIARLAGLGAYGASAGMLGLFALIMFFTRHTPTGGMTWDLSILLWVALAVVFAALIAAHVAIGNQLLEIGKDRGPTRP
jgi:hypothetical protein